MRIIQFRRLAAPKVVRLVVVCIAAHSLAALAFEMPPLDTPATAAKKTIQESALPDLSGHKRVGVASFYADEFAGKRMADGAPMNPRGDNAASRTLPLGTTAKVTNVETGQTAVVKIQDRGPYVPGRIVDLSPSTAKKIGIPHDKGVATVEVAPISIPQKDGSRKSGDGAQRVKGRPLP